MIVYLLHGCFRCSTLRSLWFAIHFVGGGLPDDSLLLVEDWPCLLSMGNVALHLVDLCVALVHVLLLFVPPVPLVLVLMSDWYLRIVEG